MFVRVFSVLSYLTSTNPTPMCLAPSALHVITSWSFLWRNFAVWTLSNWVCSHPEFECNRSFILTFASVPNASTLETIFLATFTNDPIVTASWFAHYFTTVRSCTPLELAVLTDTNILLDNFKLLSHFPRAKLLNLLSIKKLFALELHARQFHGFTWLNPCLEMISVTVNAESMAALKSEEVISFIVWIAAVARFTTWLERFSFYI